MSNELRVNRGSAANFKPSCENNVTATNYAQLLSYFVNQLLGGRRIVEPMIHSIVRLWQFTHVHREQPHGHDLSLATRSSIVTIGQKNASLLRHLLNLRIDSIIVVVRLQCEYTPERLFHVSRVNVTRSKSVVLSQQAHLHHRRPSKERR